MKESTTKTINEYIIYHDNYIKKYGDKTIVLMEVGSFYEVYQLETLDTQNKMGFDLDFLSDLTDLHKSKKQEITYEGEKVKVFMAGFPTHSQEKFINKLLNAGFTIIIVDQTGENPDNSKVREVTKVLSPGTVLENYSKLENPSNNVISIVFNKGKDPSTKNIIYIAGISIIDFTTGISYFTQIESTPQDNKLWIDECYRIIHSYQPREIIFALSRDLKENESLFTYESLSKEFICKELPVHYIEKIPDQYYKLSFINELLGKVYPNETSYSILDYLDLSNYEEVRSSFVYLIQFAYEHDRTIIEKIKKPINEQSSELAILSCNAIHQLDIVSQSDGFCLMKLLNKCSTQMGKRNFHYNLLHPTVNITILNKRYDNIEKLQKKDLSNVTLCNKIHKDLKSIVDIEKIHRRIGLLKVHPCELSSIMLSYSFIYNILKYAQETLGTNFCGNSVEFMEDFIKLKNCLDKLFNRDKLMEFTTITDTNDNIFNSGIFTEIEEYSDKNSAIINHHEEITKVFSKMIDDSKYTQKGEKVVKCDYDEKNGIVIYCTLNRGKKLNEALKRHKNGVLIFKDKISKKNISTKNEKNTCIITIKEYSEMSNNYIVNIQKMKHIIIERYNDTLKKVYIDFSNTMDKLNTIISELDIASTNAYIAIENCYCKPKIIAREDSFVDAVELRHPIVEKLQCNQDSPYVTNNFILDTDQKGILLFGTNACGKSTLMKATGLSLIMAQSGMYTPAFDFHYMPYKNFFTRILGNDNIYRGLSSFAVEMTELRSIFKRIDNRGLVLGDEVCHGTESISALAIVTSAIEGLCEKKCNFIFATHLHELNNMPELKKYTQVQKYHLKVVRNEKNEIEYDRKLTPGSGPPIYGLEVARAMDLDKDLIDRANKILLRITNGSSDLIPDKPSHFNSQVNVDKCKICQEPATETHHIKEQNEADEDGMFKKEGHHKNRKSNLVPLCEKCHNEVHHGKLIIKGYLKTSSGNTLDYFYNKQELIKKSKYTDEQLEIIKNMQIKQPVRCKAVLELKKKNINISSATLKKYWCM